MSSRANKLRSIKLTLLSLCLTSSLSTAWAMSAEEARHLLHRTGFGVSQTQWQAIIGLDYEDAVDKIVDDASAKQTIAPPDWVNDTPLWTISQRGWTTEQRRELRLKKRAKINELRNWWIYQMVSTPTPLRERMTLFWSNHFTTQYSKNFAPMLIFQQHNTLRSHALKRFDQMLLEVLRDPAMLLYLDNDKNKANSVNENLARELMELFTLGEGHYSEQDVKEAARCLTGRGVNRKTGDYQLIDKRRDSRSKTVLGKSGDIAGDELAALLLDNNATAERVVRKLWLEFVSMTPNNDVVKRWAQSFKKNNYAIDELLKTIFKSPEFKANQHRGVLVKSPTELFVGLMRPALDGLSLNEVQTRIEATRPGKRLPKLFEQAGQNLFEPPSVEGWPGGLEWIDSRTLLAREQTARNLVMALAFEKPSTSNPYLSLLDRDKSSSRALNDLNAVDPVTEIPVTYSQERLLVELIRDPVVHVK